MSGTSVARREALAVLGEARRRNAYARELLRSSSRINALGVQDRALVSRLVLGVTGAIGLLDKIIDSHLTGRAHLEPRVRDALRLSAYELLFLSTPEAVAVSQGVELVRSVRARAAGMANAVLRHVAYDDAKARSQALERLDNRTASIGDLELVSGHPAWLLGLIQEERGFNVAVEMARSACEAAPVYVAAVSSLYDENETRDLLADAGLQPEKVDVEGAFLLAAPAGLFASGLVQRGEVVVADLSAQRVAQLVDAWPKKRVLEVGQGRGTKSLLMQSYAMRRGGPARVVGVDAESHKTRVSRRRMEQAGISQWVRCITADGTSLADPQVVEHLGGPFDAVLVDAPCSGSGTLRRHPEKAWSLKSEDLDPKRRESLPALQVSLLEAAANAVAPGGALCYATCSVLRAENEDVVEAFLAGEYGAPFELAVDLFATSPSAGGPDGHFCARLQRRDA